MWTDERKREAALMAPVGTLLLRQDTQLIDADGWYQVITPSTPSESANQIVLSVIEGDVDARIDARIDEVVSTYRALGVPFKWSVYPWSQPADLGDRLAARGMSPIDVRAMVAPVSSAVDAPSDVVAERITPATIDVFTEVMAAGWGMNPEENVFYREALLRRIEVEPGQAGRAHLFVARVDGTPVATAATFLRDDGSGFLVGAVVLEAFRGRGIYRALLKHRLAALAVEGLELVTTHAMESTSAPMLEHFGFETVFSYRSYQHLLPSPPTSAV